MKLWMVLLMWGKIGGVWGPLPYDNIECWQRANDENGRLWAAMDRHPSPASNRANTFYVCLQSDARPILTDQQP
jgi:hypothetical protein